jgi:hypothetical protein
MTWVIAVAYPILGIVMADVRISVLIDGRLVEVQTAGLRKVRLFSPTTAAGFSAADIRRAWAALDRLEQYFQTIGENAPLAEPARRVGHRGQAGGRARSPDGVPRSPGAHEPHD